MRHNNKRGKATSSTNITTAAGGGRSESAEKADISQHRRHKVNVEKKDKTSPPKSLEDQRGPGLQAGGQLWETVHARSARAARHKTPELTSEWS